MRVVTSTSALRQKFGTSAPGIVKLLERFGNILDVSGQGTPDAVRQAIYAAPGSDEICIAGGYDIVPPFIRPNPTFGMSEDEDQDIPTDAPYGVAPLSARQLEYAPTRIVGRIPDAGQHASSFSKILSLQCRAAAQTSAGKPTFPTPAGSFEHAAKEFDGAAKYVHSKIPGTSGKQLRSPPSTTDDFGLPSMIAHKGRIHVLLHGADFAPDWSFLWGHDSAPNSPWLKGLSARIFDLCDLRGAIVTFSSCFAGMLDTGGADNAHRTQDNQVMLACIGHGAKAVFAATRSNWIGVSTPYDSYGPGLIARVWIELKKGCPAGKALVNAKASYMKDVLAGSRADWPYGKKTSLQAQLYGNPLAIL